MKYDEQLMERSRDLEEFIHLAFHRFSLIDFPFRRGSDAN